MKKFLKWVFLVLISIIVLFELYLLASGKLFVNKVLAGTLLIGKTGPDIDELEQFPKHRIENGRPEPWNISTDYGRMELPEDLLKQMEGFKTVSFLVIKNDSIIYEKNWEGYGDSSYVNSFSMAKSINSILIGCALREGLIKTIDEPVCHYLDEFKTPSKAGITIRNLLTMSSGLDFNEAYLSPFAWPAEAYFGADVNALTLRAGTLNDPGKTWIYKGGDSQLLGMILKKVLKGKTIADYAAEKLWRPLGAEHPAYWSTDDRGMEKVSCCFYTNARDFARIMKLYLNLGNWKGSQIVDSSYAEESVRKAPLVDKEGKPNNKYGFQWWLMNHKGHDIFYMRGIRGQYAFAIPDLKMIVVRLGHKRAPKSGDELPADIFTYLDAAYQLADIN